MIKSLLYAALPLAVIFGAAPSYAEKTPPVVAAAACRAYIQNHVQPDFNAGMDREGRMYAYGVDLANEAFFQCLRQKFGILAERGN